MAYLYGLTKKDMKAIQQAFEKHSDRLEKVVLFGSRARGDFRDASDIDLAVFTWDLEEDLLSLKEDLNKAEIIHTVDVINYKKISNEALRKEIDEEGKLIFHTTREGEFLVTVNKLAYKYKDYQNALGKLKESLLRDPHTDDLVLDATIQRFEFTYELAWKLMKVYLSYVGNNEATNPRSAIREAFKEGLLSEGDAWLHMLQDRNLTSHTYDEETAWAIWDNIKAKHLQSFENFSSKMEERINAIVQEN